jgi:hypothetical protein
MGKNVFIPAGCIHWPLGEKHLLDQWIKDLKETPNSFSLLLGDTTDLARTHFRKHLKSYLEDENSVLAIDEMVKTQVEALAAKLKPVSKKILGAVLGNHYYQFASGVNTEQYLCQLLGIPYLGPTGVIKLCFREPSNDNFTRQSLIIYAHHHGGSMGGRTTGSDVNTMEKAENVFDADIYVLSHTHRRHAFRSPKLTLDDSNPPKVKERTKIFIRSGAMLKGYKEDDPQVDQQHLPSYAETAAYRPTDLGYVRLGIDVQRSHRDVKVTYQITM